MPPSKPARIVIFGASGRLGRLLAARFHGQGHEIVPVGRREEALSDLPGEPVILDLEKNEEAPLFIRAGDIVINTAHARFTQAIAKLCPKNIARLVVVGSARYLTRFPDAKAAQVTDAARFLKKSSLPWVLLHPTMIYGAEGENNVQRMAALIRRFHIVPLPGGGHALIQPVHVGDVVEAVAAAALKPGLDGKTIHLGGPEAISYRAFLEAIARAAGTWVHVVPLPVPLLRLMARVTSVLPGIPSVTDAEVMRLQEDKAIDNSPMKIILDITPRPLGEGLKQTFGPKA